jgi:2-dehydro-3-deoxyphosphogluconate aldolase/(4S)-4-hydroxy-2-oxoglutarate aldolase
MSADIYAKLGQLKVVPIIAMDEAEAALPLADALLEGGLPIAEITFRTEAAAGVIRTLKDKRPELTLGAGTVLTPDQVRRARDCGAAFAVAPGLNPKVVAAAQAVGLPFAPGIMTPSDIEAALEMGLTVLKVFPAEMIGGVKMLQALSAPYRHTGVRFIPTGGIHTGNFLEYLALDVVLAVGGTWVAAREDIAARNWGKIVAHCRQIRREMDGAGRKREMGTGH